MVGKSPGTPSSVSTELLAQVCEEGTLKCDLTAKLGTGRERSTQRSFHPPWPRIDPGGGDAGFIMHH